MTKKHIVMGIVFGILIVIFATVLFLIKPMEKDAKEALFVISRTNQDETVKRLYDDGYIRLPLSLLLARFTTFDFKEIKPGGYYISKSMDARKLIITLTAEPQLKWITFPEGLRKEEVGERLAKEIHWDKDQLEKWNTVYTAMEFDYREGVYFPDTYLIPVNEYGLDTAKRMINRFNERFAGYPEKFAQKDILWTTALKIASIVQREAAGKEDMPLIAGVIWNRLLIEQPLEIDATIQYARGDTGSGWWAPIKPADIQNIDSPYNTYKYKGLPPTPISNPGMDAIDAVLNPEETDCYYYLHGGDRQIHCAKTLPEHEANIDRFLR